MTALIDGEQIESRDELHDTLAQQLHLPSWYGRNLDALYDCMTDIREDTVLRVIHGDALFAHLGVYSDVLCSLLCDAAEENDRLHVELEGDAH